jgi:hypothetical protein
LLANFFLLTTVLVPDTTYFDTNLSIFSFVAFCYSFPFFILAVTGSHVDGSEWRSESEPRSDLSVVKSWKIVRQLWKRFSDKVILIFYSILLLLAFKGRIQTRLGSDSCKKMSSLDQDFFPDKNSILLVLVTALG